jgi:hypothetical protein
MELAATMAAGVRDEVAEQVAANTMIRSFGAAGIKTPADVERMLEMYALGMWYLAELRRDASAQALCAYAPSVGTERALQIAASVNHLGHHEVRELRDSWKAQADGDTGIVGSIRE